MPKACALAELGLKKMKMPKSAKINTARTTRIIPNKIPYDYLEIGQRLLPRTLK
jgi:hypothetical protein